MENFIKEGKNGFAFDQLSSPDFYTNATKLQISVLAYNFHNWFSRLCLSKNMKKNLVGTVRIQLIKIAGKVVNSSRYLTFKLCSSCLYQKEYWATLANIQRLPVFR
ncbi:transposase [Tepidibacillus marianensis]|uniref:transposase n=1 Tax=Tepidibacillus marianensis TaxID=3131995 RepID=UPI00338EB93D